MLAAREERDLLAALQLSLAEAHDVRVHPSLEFRETERSGRGLFASRDVPIGEVLLSVPRALALSVQDGAGASLPPDGAWPRVRAGVAAASPDAGKSWECVLARAVADAVAGDGGAFWANYGGVMPPLESLALPFLIPDGELASLEDAALAEDALVERARIAALMPDLLDPVGEEGGEEARAAPSDDGGKPPDVARSVAAWALALVPPVIFALACPGASSMHLQFDCRTWLSRGSSLGVYLDAACTQEVFHCLNFPLRGPNARNVTDN